MSDAINNYQAQQNHLDLINSVQHAIQKDIGGNDPYQYSDDQLMTYLGAYLTQLQNLEQQLRSIPQPTSAHVLETEYPTLLSQIQSLLNGDGTSENPGLSTVMKDMQTCAFNDPTDYPQVSTLVENSSGVFPAMYSDMFSGTIGGESLSGSSADGQNSLASFLSGAINENNQNFLNSLIAATKNLNPNH